MQRLISVLLVGFVIIKLSAAASEWERPSFCRGLACPRFTKEEDTSDIKDNYQVRVYEPAKWVSTKVSTTSFSDASRRGFMRLFKYISGSNKENKKIDMTAPVSVRVLAGPGPACGSDFIVSFYLDETVATNPPEPTDTNVFIEEREKLRVAVAEFGGYWDKYEEKVVPVIESLVKSIQKRGETFKNQDTPALWLAGYDSPFRFWNRHNEVWLQLTDSCNDTNESAFKNILSKDRSSTIVA